VFNYFREINHFLVVTVNSAILSIMLSHFVKMFNHLSLLSHFLLLKIMSAIFPLLSNFLPLEIVNHFPLLSHFAREREVAQSRGSAGGRLLVA
jgi:hypothetical protein